MRKLSRIILLSIALSSYNPYYSNPKPKVIMPTYYSVGVIPFDKIEDYITNYKNLYSFLDLIGFKESSNNYKAVNKFGYLGKYQFSKRTLKGLKYKIPPNVFLNSPKLQEEAMVKLLKHNRKILQKYISKYEFTFQNNIFITESGILAAAHLAGPSNVKKWFGGVEFKDGLGTSISDYMKTFSGYDLKHL